MSIQYPLEKPLKVEFIQPIFEEDFPERFMKANLVDIGFDAKAESYKLYFNFTEFADSNEVYMKAEYFPNIHTDKIDPDRTRMYTAKEAGFYTHHYSVYFDVPGCVRDDEKFAIEIQKFLKVVE